MISLDYNLSQLYKQSTGKFYNHNIQIDDEAGLCVIHPNNNLEAVMESQEVSVPETRLDYSIAGIEELCDPKSELYQLSSHAKVIVNFSP
ncbi:hypothetical protein [Aliivibrio logei]|uniref:hypothetical protein n=1 Tax=Aliivibrio logei TaxID=688 RepID=UPI0035C91AB4